MPSAADILEGLSAIAKSWRMLALLWHAYIAFFVVAVLIGWRPTNRLAGAVLIAPLVSVSILAWTVSNPFNGGSFGLLAIALAALLRILPVTPVRLASAPWLAIGALLVGFGWIYPHFLEDSPSSVYLYAAPFGLIPCPTLSVAAGASIVFRGLGSRAWSGVLFAAASFYGVFGSFYLGVNIDWVLTAGAAGLLVLGLQLASDDAA